jgi:hypothetical protein
VEPGTTFVLEDQRVDKHLWVVLSDPEQFPDAVVIVSFTTMREGSEATCVVEPNEHPGWLTHQSCVAYKFAKVVTLEQLFALKISGKLKVLPDKVSPALLTRIFASTPNSPGIEDKIAEVLEEQGYINLSE